MRSEDEIRLRHMLDAALEAANLKSPAQLSGKKFEAPQPLKVLDDYSFTIESGKVVFFGWHQ